MAGPFCILLPESSCWLQNQKLSVSCQRWFPAWQPDGPTLPPALAAASCAVLPSSLTIISRGQPAAGHPTLRATWSPVLGAGEARVCLAARPHGWLVAPGAKTSSPLTSLQSPQPTWRSIIYPNLGAELRPGEGEMQTVLPVGGPRQSFWK